MANHRKLTDGGHVYFSRTQLITVTVLFGAATIFIFFLGILIGQSIEERKLLQREDELVKVPVDSGAKKEDVITFYDTLTKPKPASDAKPPEKPQAVRASTPWTIQVTAPQSRATADSMAAKLKQRGYEAYVTARQLNRKTFYRVRVGRYRTRRDAVTDLRRLKTENYKNAYITGSQ